MSTCARGQKGTCMNEWIKEIQRLWWIDKFM